ncbi:hypothetical protein CR513_10275, partial [Mucuna pruriens]
MVKRLICNKNKVPKSRRNSFELVEKGLIAKKHFTKIQLVHLEVFGAFRTKTLQKWKFDPILINGSI